MDMTSDHKLWHAGTKSTKLRLESTCENRSFLPSSVSII